jgi:hypothetical protein
MFVLVGVTKGDDLIHSQVVILGADESREVVEHHLQAAKREHDVWIAENPNAVPWWAQEAVYSRFEIVEAPTLSTHKIKTGKVVETKAA